MPALRERPADINLLFRKFASDFSAKYGMAKVALTEDAAILLRKYRWPGNIRQLKNIAEAVSALESSKIAPGADKCIIDADVLSRYIPKEEPNLLPATVQQQDKFETGEREAIIRTLLQLRQDVDYLKEIIEGAGLGRRTSLPVVLPELQDETAEWAQPQNGYGEDPEDQDPEEQLLETAEPEQMSMKEASLELIEKALQKHGGNRKAAAKELGISERTIYRKLGQMKKKE
jgi:DNA-binding NtrC family response regulator